MLSCTIWIHKSRCVNKKKQDVFENRDQQRQTVGVFQTEVELEECPKLTQRMTFQLELLENASRLHADLDAVHCHTIILNSEQKL